MSLKERKIKNGIKRVLKKFPQYKIVKDIDDADLAFIYSDEDLNKFNIVAINPSVKEHLKNNNDEKITVYYLKHKNDRNKKQIINNDVGKNHFMLQG